MTFRVVIVAAVSTAAQVGDDKASLPEQIAQCRRVCEARGWPVVATISIPGHSRAYDWLHEIVRDSPEYAELVRVIESDTVSLTVTAAYDRLWRSDALRAQVTALCRQHRVQVYSCAEPVEPVSPDRLETTDTSRLAEVLFGFISEQENRTRTRRRAVGMRARVARGLHTASRLPYGYERAGPGEPMRVVPEYARWVRFAFERRADGYGYIAIMHDLNAQHVPAPFGGEWTFGPIREMLHRDVYIGAAHWGDTSNPQGQHEAIIEPELWRQVQDVNEAHSAWRGRREVHPLTGLVKCGLCGWGVGYTRHRAGFWYLRCNRYGRSRSLCDMGHFRAVPVEVFVKAAVREALDDPEAWADRQRRQIDDGAIARELPDLDARLADAERRWARWNDIYERGAISADELLGHRERIEAQTRLARERRDVLTRQRLDVTESATRLASLGEVVSLLDRLDDAHLREVYGLLIRRVILRRDATTRAPLDPVVEWR